MKFVRALIADRSLAAAIIVILAQALILVSSLESYAKTAGLFESNHAASSVICTGQQIVEADDGADHECCDESLCAVICAQAGHACSAQDRQDATIDYDVTRVPETTSLTSALNACPLAQPVGIRPIGARAPPISSSGSPHSDPVLNVGAALFVTA